MICVNATISRLTCDYYVSTPVIAAQRSVVAAVKSSKSHFLSFLLSEGAERKLNLLGLSCKWGICVQTTAT